MSGNIRFLLFSIALLVAVVGYLAVDHVARLRGDVASGTRKPPTRSLPHAPAAPIAAAPAAPAATPVTPPTDAAAEARAAFGICVQPLFPTQADAEERAAACSRALQTRQLKPAEIALARLTRGIARTALGDKALASDDYADAVQRYDSLINPGNPDSLALYRRAVALEGTGQTERAIEDYTAAIKADPKAALAFLGRGVLLAVRKRAYDRAIEDFDKVLVLQPDNVDALVGRGDAFSQLGDSGRALADLNRAATLAPNNALVLLARGQAQGRRGEAAAAQRDYEAALKAEPRNAAVLVNLAALLARRGDLAGALPLLDRAIAADPRNALAYYNRGYVYFTLKHYDQALADYTAAIGIDPDFGLALNNRALTRVILNRDLKPALDDADLALKLMPINLDVRETRGFIFLKLNEPAQALLEYEAALNLDPNRALSLYGRGLARLRMGDAGGKADEAAALTLSPDVENEFAVYGLK